MNSDEIQQKCSSMGVVLVPENINFDESDYLAGLCPVCKEPIRVSLVHGGKLSPSRRTLSARHAFSGRQQCENKQIREKLAVMTGQEKSDFFALLRDTEVMKGMPDDYQHQQLRKMWPGKPESFFNLVSNAK